MRAAVLAIAILAQASAAAAQTSPEPPKAQVLAPGVWLIPGRVVADREPDGNTIIWQAPEGLVVMDTGRHAWHRQAILDFARARGQPIVAIVNSHWHLDHTTGNLALRQAYPGAKVYASRAIEGAITGFLADSARDGRKYADDPSLPAATREDIKGDLAAIEAADRLRPDVVVEASGARVLGGLKLRLNPASDAATAGDVWVYDARAGIAAVGDLVTLPAPYLDTACPKGWSAALGQVEAAPFQTAVPGHGKPMTRAQFQLYRRAFDAFIACSGSARPAADCAAGWARDVGPLLSANGMDAKRAQGVAGYYVTGVLRAHGGKSPYCTAA